jgi:hypothetical protein
MQSDLLLATFDRLIGQQLACLLAIDRDLECYFTTTPLDTAPVTIAVSMRPSTDTIALLLDPERDYQTLRYLDDTATTTQRLFDVVDLTELLRCIRQ